MDLAKPKLSRNSNKPAHNSFEIPSNIITPTTIQSTQTTNPQQPKKYTANELKCDTNLLNALRDTINDNKVDKDGWLNYAVFVSYFQNTYPAIKPEHYGYKKLHELIDVIDIFEGKKENSTIFIRIKPNNIPKTKPKKQYSADELKKDTLLLNAIKDSIIKNLENGWANFSIFTQYLNKHYPNLKPNHYGYAKWRSLIDQIDLFETKLANKTSLFIRETTKNNSQTTKNKTPKIKNQKLLDDLLEIINENELRKNEWVHIGYLGSQLKNRGYNPKEFGVKTFGLLLKNTDGVEIGKGDYLEYFTLTNKSKIKPITQKTIAQSIENITPNTINFKSTYLYQILLKNREKISNKIEEILIKNIELSVEVFWDSISKNLSAELLLENNQSQNCFIEFINNELSHFQLIKKDNKLIFCKTTKTAL